jgi:cyclin ccl1
MQELNYNLTVHNPFRPVEGFLIDIKTRCQMQNPDRLRKGIDEFLDQCFLTDACLIYAPSQIALAAVLHAASKEQENLDSYVTTSLFAESTQMLKPLIEAVRSEKQPSMGFLNIINHFVLSRNQIDGEKHWRTTRQERHKSIGKEIGEVQESK